MQNGMGGASSAMMMGGFKHPGKIFCEFLFCSVFLKISTELTLTFHSLPDMTADMLGAGPGAAGMMGQHTGGGVGFGGDGGNAFALVLKMQQSLNTHIRVP